MNAQTLEAQPAQGKKALPEAIARYIDDAKNLPHSESYLIAVLQMIQKHFGYLPASCMDEVSERMQIPSAVVTGVATFYHFFTFVPKGKHTVSVCLGTACYVKGAGLLFERLQDLLGVKPGEASKDGLFTLESARCVGACALAPVMLVDDKVYANVRPDELPKILSKYGFKPETK